MRNTFRSKIIGASCFAVVTTVLGGAAFAGPISVVNPGVISAPSVTEQVYYRHPYHRHYRHYRHYGHYGHYGHYHHYRHYGYSPYGYDPYYSPAGVVAGTALDAATLPVRVLFGGPYY